MTATNIKKKEQPSSLLCRPCLFLSSDWSVVINPAPLIDDNFNNFLREIHFYQGEAKWYGTSDDNKRQRIINVIDTIGKNKSMICFNDMFRCMKKGKSLF